MVLDQWESFSFFQRANTKKNTSNAHLLRLSSQLNHWNTERVSRKNAEGQLHDLCVEDVDALTEMVQLAIKQASVKCPEIFADQILFLVVGAIQIQSQTGSDKAWQRVHQSVVSLLDSQKEKRGFQYSLATFLLLIALTIFTVSRTPLPPVHTDTQDFQMESTTSAGTDPVTISTLLLAYNKMKSGICQLPQAAMLQPEQRAAFLMFVNKGVVDVHHVQDLRIALDYVNCLYPQELMHPVSSDGNKL